MAPHGEGPTATGEAAAWRERAAAVADGGLEPASLPLALLAEARAHARECYPEECCGLMLGPAKGEPGRLLRCTNVQSQRYSRGESQLDARHGFWIDEQELRRALLAVEECAEELLVIYHSHIDAPAYLSHTDVQNALGPDGAPLYRGVDHLVLSVEADGVHGVALFEWNAEGEHFVGRGVREVR